MRTLIVRLAEPEQTGGALRGLVEVLGETPVPFSGATALLDLISAAAGEPAAARVDDAEGPHAEPA